MPTPIGKSSSLSEERSALDADQHDRCAPIRQTAVAELNGLFRFAMARVDHQAHVAEDVVQQTLLIAITHASPPPQVPVQRAWLRGIAKNVIRHDLRSTRRRREATNRAAAQWDMAIAGDPQGDTNRAHMVRSLCLAVTELSQADQDLFYAFYRAGRSHACIAQELGTTAKGVEARLYRLRSRLRAAWKDIEESPA